MSDAGRYRVHARTKLDLRVVVWHPRAGWQREAQAVDAGLGGAGVVLDDPVAPGDVVTVSFAAPAVAGRVSIEARVAWVADEGDGRRVRAGLSFVPRDPAALLALFELLASPAATR